FTAIKNRGCLQSIDLHAGREYDGPRVGARPQNDGEPRAPHATALAVPAALGLAAGSPTPWTSLAIGIGGALVAAAFGVFVPRLAHSRQTAGELASALVVALMIAAAVTSANLGPGVMAFAAVLVSLHVVLCAVWHTSALGTVL